MKFLSFTLLGYAFLLPLSAAAQGEVDAEALPEIRAVIGGPRDVAIGKTIVLDGSLSSAEEKTVSYLWMLDGRIVSRVAEAVLTLEKPGEYTIELTVRDRIGKQAREAKAAQKMTVYLRKLVLIAGPDVPQEKVELHRESGRALGIFVDALPLRALAIPLGTEDALTKLIAENVGRLQGAEVVVLWAEGATAMNALLRALQGDPERLALLQAQNIVMITERGLQTLARVIRGPFSVLHPQRVILTRKEAINPLVEAESIDVFLADIEQRDIDSFVVDRSTFAVRPWNLLSTLTNYMITHGVSGDMIILLLMLPIILTLITFLKQIVGITTFGLYTPAVITLSLVALGWTIGLTLLSIILVAGYVTRALMARHHLLYIPKIAIILSVTSIVLLIVLALAATFGITLSPDAIFILLIMTTLSEEFMSVKAELGLRSAVFAVGETVFVASLCTFIVKWGALQSLILAYPELILLTFIVNLFLGRYAGLRITEMVRFREVFKYLEE